MNPLHRRILSLSGGVLLLVALLIIFFRDGDPPPPAEKKVAAPRQNVSSRTERRPESGVPMLDPAKVGNVDPASRGPAKTVEQASDEILKLSVQYSPESVPLIAPYLVDPDKRIRTVALEGMLNNGETAGAAELRKAAAKLEDPEEAAAYIKAAEYLELPSDSTIK